ncbi:MAG: hypothetical protein KAT70_02440 [Thermoplasmata archaeon]|nr:hypothetical protein [Thermoplasmata archaeon]
MADVEIEIPVGKQTEGSAGDGGMSEQPSELSEQTEAQPGRAIQIEAGDDRAMEQAPPPTKTPKKGGKLFMTLMVVVLVIIGGFGAFWLFSPEVADVQIFRDMIGEDGVTMRIQVVTGFMKTYDGDVQILIEHEGTSTGEAVTVKVSDSSAVTTIDYEDFYIDNGEYTFTVKIEDHTDSTALEFHKTANYIDVSSPGGGRWDPLIADDTVRSQSFGFRWKDTTGQDAYLDLGNIKGNGTLYLWDTNITGAANENDTLNNDLSDDNLLAWVNFEIRTLGSTGSQIEVGSPHNCSSIDSFVENKQHVIDFYFTTDAYPLDAWTYLTVEFTNAYPESPPADDLVFITGQSAAGWMGDQ